MGVLSGDTKKGPSNNAAGGGGNSKRVKKAFGHEKKTDDQGIEIDSFDTRKRNTRTGGLSAYGKE